MSIFTDGLPLLCRNLSMIFHNDAKTYRRCSNIMPIVIPGLPLLCQYLSQVFHYYVNTYTSYSPIMTTLIQYLLCFHQQLYQGFPYYVNHYPMSSSIMTSPVPGLPFYDKVRKTARIRNRYNQVTYLSQDTKWESNKITINVTNKSQEVSPFPSVEHKAAMNRRESMANIRHE